MIKYKIHRRFNRKSVRVKIVSAREITVFAPFFCSKRAIEKILAENRAWIFHKIEQLKEKPPILDKNKLPSHANRQTEDSYIRRAKKIFTERLEHYGRILNVKPRAVRFKNQKTRWGSCSSRKNINLNWNLIKAPLEVIDYVIAHELCHLKHLNHSPDFWCLLSKIIPNYKFHIKWLKKNTKNLLN